MTKQRQPLSYENALTKVAAQIGWERAAEIAGVSERTIRNWSDPDTSAALTLDKADALDHAYLALGGEAPPPFFQCYALRIDIAVTAQSGNFRRLLSRAGSIAVESGQAVSALVKAAMPNATVTDQLVATRETEEAIQVMTGALADLKSNGAQPP